MDIIKTSRGIKRTITNMGRFKEILTVLAKNGLSEVIYKMQLHRFFPSGGGFDEQKEKKERETTSSFAAKLRRSFEELGPTFIKLGQLLSTRDDLFEEEFLQEMRQLLDKVGPLPFSKVENQVEEALGRPVKDIFAEIEDTPIGVASIGLVYRGLLKDGSKVVLKVKRPSIDKKVETDLSILKFMATSLEKLGDEIKYISPTRLIDDFSNQLQQELDFLQEGLNLVRMKKVIDKIDEKEIFYLPQIYKEYNHRNLIVMEYLEGIPLSNPSLKNKKDLEEKLMDGVAVFMSSLLSEGFFHADLHAGNLFYLKNEKVGVVDFGLVGQLGKKARLNLLSLLYSLVNFDFENLVYEFLDVATYEEMPDVDLVIRDVKSALSPFVGLTVRQTNLALLLNSVIQVMSRHRVYLPRDWFIVFRALIMLDGLGKVMELDFDIYSILGKELSKSASGPFDKAYLQEEGLYLSKDIIALLRILPRHLRWFIRDRSRDGYQLKIKLGETDKSIKQLSSSFFFLAQCLLTSIFFIAGVLFLFIPSRIEFWESFGPYIFWLLALMSYGVGLFRLRK